VSVSWEEETGGGGSIMRRGGKTKIELLGR
jgi:hypothetical protein